MVEQSPCPGAGAPEFHLRDGALFCEDVALEALAQQFGTPLYVYSAGVVRARARRVKQRFVGGGFEERTYRDWVVQRFGDSAYFALYRDYAERRWGPPELTSVSAARVYHGQTVSLE